MPTRAASAAIAFTILGSCRLAGVDPIAYLTDVLPKARAAIPPGYRLWMPVMAAVHHNPWPRAFYERLVAGGKPRKLALIAAMRRLAHAIYSIARNCRPFVPRLAVVSEGA